jgi:hypothetical protein
VVFMNARRFISYGVVMALPLQLDDPGTVTSSTLGWTGASRQPSVVGQFEFSAAFASRS